MSLVPVPRRDLTKHQIQLSIKQRSCWNNRDEAEPGKGECTARDVAKVSEAVCTAVRPSGLLQPWVLTPDISVGENQALPLPFRLPQHLRVPLGVERF